MPPRAVIYSRSSALTEEFTRDLMRRKFGASLADAIMAELGTYTRGPRKGLQRGYLNWKKCEHGGWFKGDGVGRVVYPGTYGYTVSMERDGTVLAHEPSELSGPNDAEKEARILEGVRQTLAARKR